MNAAKIAAIVLIVAGVLGLAYGSFSYTKQTHDIKMGPIEICAVLLFSLTFIAALSGPSLIKGLIAGLLGLFCANVGLDAETAVPRLTFGFVDLQDGIPLLAVGVGVLALSEMMLQIEASLTAPAGTAEADAVRI